VICFPCACREVVRKALAWLWLDQGKVASDSDSAYCQARARLSQPWLQEIGRLVVEKLQAQSRPPHHWHQRRVIVIDGSAVSMPDTPENQQAYPQSSRQKPGCGFPIARLVAAFSLATGAMMEIVWDKLAVGERTLFHRLWERFQPGDVVLADCGFCGYADFWVLRQRGVDCVMRNHPRRSKGVKLIKQLSKNDRLVLWLKTKTWIKWLDWKSWKAMPETMTVREIRVVIDIPGFRTEKMTLVTTLLDEKEYLGRDFADLYRRRWLAELFLRDIKITLGMDVLHCKTPAMVDKEIHMHVIVYNLIRALMFQAAVENGLDPFRLSFKGAMDTIKQWEPVLKVCEEPEEVVALILKLLAADKLPHRPNRTEPRALKRRKKNYQLLNRPRHLFQEIRHRNKYKKCLS